MSRAFENFDKISRQTLLISTQLSDPASNLCNVDENS